MVNDLITVIMPVRNGENYIKEAIEGIKAQNMNIEIIIVDDASTDNTAKIAEDLGIKVIKHKKCLGLVLSKNTGLKAAKGKYIMFHDHDDVMNKNVLSKMYEEITKNNDEVAIMAKVKDFLSPDAKDTNSQIKPEAYYGLFTGAILIRKDLFNKIGLLDENVRAGDILGFQIKMQEQGYEFKKIDLVATNRRIHDTNFGKTNQKEQFKNYAKALRTKIQGNLNNNLLDKELPTRLTVDASTVCQLNCVDCYMRKAETPPCGTGFLKFEDFKKIIDDNYLVSIELSNSGEIFLNPDILKIIKYGYEKNVLLSAYNGVNLNTVSDEILESLVKYRFSGLSVSIDGASNETYSLYRVGGSFDKVISNIKKINEYKKKYNSKLPHIKWQYILFGHNEHEIPRAKQMAQELNMDIIFKLNWDNKYSPINDADLVKRKTGLAFVTRASFSKAEHKEYSQACFRLWDNPVINWDGKLLGCCCVYKTDFGVNVFEVGLSKALQAEKFKYAKDMIMNKKKGRADIPCFDCRTYKTMQEYNCYYSR